MAWRKFKSDGDLTSFSFSDRPVQEKLGRGAKERGLQT